ncbi:hypothetical protein ACODUO_14840 [Stenotrophomonas maltophilia]
MSYRFYNPAPVFLDLLGLQPLANGRLQFYEIGTTTPKNTWSDPSLTIPNSNPVVLDSSGRSNTNIWLDGAYSVRLLDSLGATVWTRDVDSGLDQGLTIPSLISGQFLTNDGSNLLWGDIRQVPDPTGSANKILSTDGSDLIWIAQPTIPASPVTLTGSSIKTTGNGFIILEQWGVGTMPANNLQSAAVSFNFPTAFSEVPNVQVTIQKGSPVVAEGYTGSIRISPSASGCGVEWEVGIDATRTGLRLVDPFQFAWHAIGRVAS